MFETLNAEKKQLIEDNVAMTNELVRMGLCSSKSRICLRRRWAIWRERKAERHRKMTKRKRARRKRKRKQLVDEREIMQISNGRSKSSRAAHSR